MNDPIEQPASPDARSTKPTGRRVIAAVALLAAMAVGAGADVIAHHGRAVTYVALTPQPIAKLQAGTTAAVRGKVTEIYGNKFVLQDPSGRTLIETGRAGEGAPLVVADEEVTVQGRFERGFVHAIAVTHGDNRTDTLDPPPPPPPGGPRRDPPPPPAD